jgi:hypothetical protein
VRQAPVERGPQVGELAPQPLQPCDVAGLEQRRAVRLAERDEEARVPRRRVRGLGGAGQPLPGVGAHRLEQPVARRPVRRPGHDQRLVDQARQGVQRLGQRPLQCLAAAGPLGQRVGLQIG